MAENKFIEQFQFKKIYWVLPIVLVYLVCNIYLMTKGNMELNALPLAVFMIYLAFVRPDWLIVILVFCTPLSINLEDLGSLGGIGFYLPTEPMLFGLMLLYLVNIFLGHKEDKRFLRHPLTITIFIYLGWLLITTLTSTLPVVSLKFLLSRLWFVLVIYFMINRLFKNPAYIRKYLWAYILGFSIVLVYTLVAHSLHNFNEKIAHYIMNPFFKDHTSYGALIAMFYPLIIVFLLNKRYSGIMKTFLFGIFILFTIALIFSYTRAAWVSLVGAFGVWIVMKLKIDFKLILLTVVILGGFLFAFQDQLLNTLERNRQDSSGDFAEHIQSITNISSDASNLERLNRWNSALRMFEEKPFLGFGPGTYMFTYGFYQLSADKTIISTSLGDAGNAHSEYLGPLSESGLLGMLTTLLVFITSIYLGVTLYYKVEDPELKSIVMALTLGLITYYLHGLLNNYLDTDKASIPLWGFMSILVAIDLYLKDYKNLQQSKAVSSK